MIARDKGMGGPPPSAPPAAPVKAPVVPAVKPVEPKPESGQMPQPQRAPR